MPHHMALIQARMSIMPFVMRLMIETEPAIFSFGEKSLMCF